MKREELLKLSLLELRNLCTANEIEFDDSNDAEVLMSKLLNFKKSSAPRKKVHPRLGEIVKATVYPSENQNKNTSIFVSINMDTFEFQPGIEVNLPVEVIKFLKNSTTVENYFDPNGLSDNGNVGVHTHRDVKKYIVETA